MIAHHAISIDEHGKVYPDQKITRGEIIKMMMLNQNPDPYFYKMSADFNAEQASFKDVTSSSRVFSIYRTRCTQSPH